jgi:hypothetical protein
MGTRTITVGTPTAEAPQRRRLRSLGGIAGMVVPAACAVAVYSTAVTGPNLRQGAFPWAAATGCVMAALTTASVAHCHQRAWKWGRRAVARMTTAGLMGVAAFFVVLGGEDLANRTFGTPRILSDSDLVTALGTLIASLLTVVVVPAGLLLIGIFTARAGVLPRPGRTAMLAIGPVLVLGALLTGITDASWVSATWPMLMGGCWAVVGAALLREGNIR